MEKTFDYLIRRAQYSIRSKSRSLVYQTYGEACMARKLEAISKDQYYELNTMLVVNTMNNGRVWRTFHI